MLKRLLFLLLAVSVSFNFGLSLARPSIAIAGCGAPIVSFTNNGFGFKVDGPCALSHYTPTYCDDSTGSKIEDKEGDLALSKQDQNDDEDDFETVLSKEIKSIDWKASGFTGIKSRDCTPPVEEKKISIFVECVQPGEGEYGAVFGYKNENEGPIELKESYFTPSLAVTPLSTVQPGRHLLSMINVPFWGNLVWTIKTPAGVKKTATASPNYQKICEPDATDVCPNIEGDQETIPEGMVKDDAGNCVDEPNDVCPNIEGDQESVPEGKYIDESGNCVDKKEDEPEETPGPTPEPESEAKKDFWSYTDCDGRVVLRFTFLENDGSGANDKVVKFFYNNEVKETKTNVEGKAGADFRYAGEKEAKVEFDGETKTTTVKAAENCGTVLGATTGKVLGTSTLAATGVSADAIMNILGFSGMTLTALGYRKYGKKN